MVKSHPKSKIVKVHHDSNFANTNMGVIESSQYVILQVEELRNSKFDLLLEIVKASDFVELI